MTDQKFVDLTEELISKDHCYLWHPYTHQKLWCSKPSLVINSAKGSILTDTLGNNYLDGNSSIWTNIHGHSHPKIISAITRQAEKLDHVSFLGTTHPVAIELAEKLIHIMPQNNLKRVFFTDNGSTAIEVAVKMSIQFWQQMGKSKKCRFIAFKGAYHGDTLGAASLGDIRIFFNRFKQFHFEVEFLDHINDIFNIQNIDTVAAVIIEPIVQAVSGMQLWPSGQLQMLRSFCNESQSLLIFDEIMTGFGRTGTLFACQQEDVNPDILCLAKGLTGGTLPLAATIVTEEIYQGFLGEVSEMKTLYYGHSYAANPIGCAAALANLEIFAIEDTLNAIQPKIEFFKKRLMNLYHLNYVSDVRIVGLIAGIELMLDPIKKINFSPYQLVGYHVCEIARRYGLLTRPILDTVIFIPPLSTTIQQIEDGIVALERAISEIQSILK